MMTKNPILYLLYTGWQYADKHRGLFLAYLLMFAVAQAITLAEPFVIGQVINCVQISATKGFSDNQQLEREILFYLGIYFLTQVGFWLFHGPARLVERFVAFHIKVNYKSSMFRKLTELPMQWHREHHSGESIDKINRASVALSEFFDNTFEVAYMLFRLIGAQIVLIWFMPIAGVVSFTIAATSVGIIFWFDKLLYKNYKELNKFDNSTASAIHDYITNIVTVITLRLEKRVLPEVLRRLNAPLNLFRHNNNLVEIKWCLTTLTIGIMVVLVLGWYSHTTLSSGKVLLAGTFFTLFEYLRRIGDSFYNFAWLYGSVTRQAADVQSAETLDVAYETRGETHETFDLPRDWKTVEISDLDFLYEDEKHRTHHLTEIDVFLERGKAIAFVGESGSGKSTLLSLIRGVQTTNNATLRCDGVEMKGALKCLNGCTTLMPQDPEIFADTIRFNITFGIDASDSDIQEAIRLARFENVLIRLPAGLDTNIAEKGINLSGGEKQRLALARGIFFAQDSDIVLLDEPTSSVDQQNEHIIYENLHERFKNKCIVSAVHKLHLLDMFDYIYVFDDGRIVEHGDLKTLLARKGRLAELWNRIDTEKTMTLEETVIATEHIVETVFDGD
jgi:ABC-type multidrug transport system fused ATPase/permease subunit